MKKSVIGFIFSIIAAFIYIIALIIIITVVDIRRGGIRGGTGGSIVGGVSDSGVSSNEKQHKS